MRLLPFGTAIPEPEVLGRYGFASGVPIAIERIINLFSPLVGYAKVAENDEIDRFDADRVVEIQRYLFEHFACDESARKAALAALDEQIDQASLDASAEEGIVVTPEQMWVSDRAGVVLDKLPRLHSQIVSGQMKDCGPSLFTGRTALVLGGVLVGAYFLLGGHR
jgi:hypothetical protein